MKGKKKLKNIFKKISTENLISIVGHLLTLISLILVFVTLREMITQRNNTYMPQIVAECNDTIEFSWNKLQDIISPNKDIDTINKQMDLEVYNVGVGVARNLEFEWANDNMRNLSEYINNNSSNFKINIEDNGRFIIKTKSLETGIGEIESINKLNFLTSNNAEPYKIDIPYQYSLLYKIMMIDQLKHYPPVHLKINFSDIQGKKYEQRLTMEIKPTFLMSIIGDETKEHTGRAKLEFSLY